MVDCSESPTCVPADFSVKHFHKMYVYACLGSTTPMGLVQMTGRVRHLEGKVILCCAAKGISFAPEAEHITAAEQLQYSYWIDQQLFKDQAMTEVLTEEGLYVDLPADNAVNYVKAANEARAINGQRRFFAEAKALLEEAGHTVELDASAVCRTIEEDALDRLQSSEREARLLGAETIPWDKYEELRSKVYRRVATEDEKWAVDAYEYCLAWRVSRVDLEFLRANGTRAHCSKMSILMRVLRPEAYNPVAPSVALSTRDKTHLLQVGIVKEALDALGFRSPFNTEHVLPGLPRTFDAATEPLLQLAPFNRWADNAKLFGCQANKKWGNKAVSEVLGAVLGAAGIAVTRAVCRSSQGEGGRKRTYTYQLDPDSVNRMQELLALRDGRAADAGRWAHLAV